MTILQSVVCLEAHQGRRCDQRTWLGLRTWLLYVTTTSILSSNPTIFSDSIWKKQLVRSELVSNIIPRDLEDVEFSLRTPEPILIHLLLFVLLKSCFSFGGLWSYWPRVTHSLRTFRCGYKFYILIANVNSTVSLNNPGGRLSSLMTDYWSGTWSAYRILFSRDPSFLTTTSTNAYAGIRTRNVCDARRWS